MINEKEVKTLEKYQFWKTVLKKEERQNYDDENVKFCFSHRTLGCSGCSTGCTCGCGAGCSGSACSGCRGCGNPR